MTITLDEDVESQVDYEYIEESDGDYDYAAIPNRSKYNTKPEMCVVEGAS